MTAAGFLIVNKPAGVTSFSMVALVRRLTGVRRVGHAGTLDPLASGVLPVAVGQAARLIEYLDGESKAYIAGVRLGVETETYDAEGAVTARGDASSLTRADIESALTEFVGAIEQAPPAYSAIKLAGKPLYRYAREGIDVKPRPRTVRIERIMLMSFEEGIATIDVKCGKGTYIRSLAHDLGRKLGCGAHLASLVRTSTGGFRIEDAHAPDALTQAAAEGAIGELMLAPDRAVERRAAAILGDERVRDVLAGRDISFEQMSPNRAAGAAPICRAYAVDGRFLGVLQIQTSGAWHPAKVLQSG